jgi:hypothetical protein
MQMRTVPLLLATAIVLATAPMAQASKPSARELAARQEIRAARVEATTAGTEVGDFDSFGRNVHFIGTMQSGTVSLQGDCTPDPSFPPGPDDRCITTAPAPAVTSINVTDVGRVLIPGRATHSIICHWQTPIVVYGFFNGTGVFQQDGRFVVTPTYTIENEVLDNPALIDPNTGLPFGGQFTVGLGGIRDERGLQPGESQVEREAGTRVCIGGIVSAQMLRGFGLTDAQVTEFFKHDTTITMNMSGNARFVEFANIIYGVRFVGD